MQHNCVASNNFFKRIFYLVLETGRQGEREGEKHQCAKETSISCLVQVPIWGPGPQPRHVP